VQASIVNDAQIRVDQCGGQPRRACRSFTFRVEGGLLRFGNGGVFDGDPAFGPAPAATQNRSTCTRTSTRFNCPQARTESAIM
jgi:hypothetical protein